jgi:signal peptidase I
LKGAADVRLEEAVLDRLARGPADALDLLAVARAIEGDPLRGREGAFHAILHRLVHDERVRSAGRGRAGCSVYALPPAAGAALPAADPPAEAPPPVSPDESRVALSVARRVRDPEDRGRVVADVLAHRAALIAQGRARDFGSRKHARLLLSRADRGHASVLAPVDTAERVSLWIRYEVPSVLVTIACVGLAWLFLVEPRVIRKHSMEPTLHDDDRVLAWKPGVSASIAPGTVVIFHDDKDEVVVKRVVARGGERIRIVDGDVVVNDRVLEKTASQCESVRAPLVRSTWPGADTGWAPVDGAPNLLRYDRPLRGDEPRNANEPTVRMEGDVHDVWVEAKFDASDRDGGRDSRPGIAIVMVGEGRSPVDAQSAWSLDVDESGHARLTRGAGPFAADARPVPLPSDAEASAGDLRLAFVDGRPWVGGERILADPNPLLPRGRAEVFVRGRPRSVGIDRDVHYLRMGSPLLGFDRPYDVPEGHLFVLGDHSVNSRDSRQTGAIPVERVIGRVFFRVWPLSRVGPVH